MSADAMKLLRAFHGMSAVSSEQLSALEKFLKPRELKDGESVFAEGSRGESFYFVGAGRVRILKRAEKGVKELAILGPGDCFGEMAMLEDAPRSAGAAALGKTVVFELTREAMSDWLKKNPQHASGFLANLIQIQSRRLRRTSNELALLYDLSAMLLEPALTAEQLMGRLLDRIAPQLEGSWASAAYVFNLFNQEMELVTSRGDFNAASFDLKIPPINDMSSQWITPACYYSCLPGDKHALGYILFHCRSALGDEERAEIGRTLSAIACLVASAIQNILYRTEESLRQRLNKTRGSLI